jgi:hypothetical protein
MLLLMTLAQPALSAAPATSTFDEQMAMLEEIKGLLAATGETRFVAPLPGSRSAVVAVDVSRDLYFYLERGSIRGSAIDGFYEAYESGDTAAAYDAFISSAIMMLRATDYGWNGLGNPMTTGKGRDERQIPDVLFKDIGGAFSRTPEISAEDIAGYEELMQTVIQLLQERG